MQPESKQSSTRLPDAAARLLQKAAALYGRGDLRGAREACWQLLQLNPGQVDALHILGLAAWRVGERDLAFDEIRKAIASEPRKPQPHNSLGVMLKELGDLAGAEAAFRTAIDLMPDYPDALTNLGNILCEAGRLVDAESLHRRVIELAPASADGHNNLATTLSKAERWDEALPECEAAVRLQPTRAEFHINLGNVLAALDSWTEAVPAFQRGAALAPHNVEAHANLGIALYHVGQPEQAAAAHRIATELQPGNARVWANFADAQVAVGDADAALKSVQRALALDPDLPEAHNSMGLVLQARGMPEEAMAAFQTAIGLRPDCHTAYNNLGTVLSSQARISEALAAYAKAIALMPDYAEAQWNKGALHLLLGEFDVGWRGYEHGLDMKRARARLPLRGISGWEGQAIAGKTIAVSGEQGVGDQIMFASLLIDLVERGSTCLVKVDTRLHPLLERSMSGLTLLPQDGLAWSRAAQAAIDFQAPIGSLCRWLRPDLASFPQRCGYLKADPKQRDRLRSCYRTRLGGRPLVGISWRGGTGNAAQTRSISLDAWAPILSQRDFGFVNLQYGNCGVDLAAVRREIGVEILHDETIDPLISLDDFAAQTAAMDLVISIDNSTVHMAGALNVPVWVMLPVMPDWRWMLGRTDSPWYSSVRLFRQSKAGEWSSVIKTVAEEMAKVLGVARPGRPGDDGVDPDARH